MPLQSRSLIAALRRLHIMQGNVDGVLKNISTNGFLFLLSCTII